MAAHKRWHERNAVKEQVREGNDLATMVKELMRRNEELQAQVQEIKAAKTEQTRALAEEELRRIEANIPLKIERAKAMFEAEKKVRYTAGAEGLDMIINHYRVTIPSNETAMIPKSFMAMIKLQEERKRKANERAFMMNQLSMNPKAFLARYPELSDVGTKAFLDRILNEPER